jgi:hypothetical protein
MVFAEPPFAGEVALDGTYMHNRVLKRLAIALVLLIVSGIGCGVSAALNAFVFEKFDAYGEVPIPGTRTLHLPAGDVTVSFHSSGKFRNGFFPIPDDLEVTITPPSGVAEPTVSRIIGNTTQSDNDAHATVRVAHIPQAGDYTITTNGSVTSYASPRLSFGQASRFWFVTWLFGGLCAVITVVGLIWFINGLRAFGRTASAAGPPTSADDARVSSNLIAARSNAPPPAAQPNEQTEDEQRRQNWAAIDSLVQEFIPEAVRRKTPRNASGTRFLIIRKRFWIVRHAQFERERYVLAIMNNGAWSFNRVNSAGNAETLAFSMGSRRMDGPAGPNPVDGLREGAWRLLNS